MSCEVFTIEALSPRSQSYDTLSDIDRLCICTNPEVLHLILLPTEQCNFRCVYCYERHRQLRMDANVIAGIKILVSRRIGDLSHLDIEWFGGEPLLELPTIREINRHIMSEIGSQNHPTFSSAMTTNGYLLTADTFYELVSLGVRRFQITLDGPKHFHDKTRIRVSGGGSFDRIWKNLLSIRDSNKLVEVILRIHVTRRNMESLDGFLSEINNQFSSDARFKVLFKTVKNFGGPGRVCAEQLHVSQKNNVIAKLEKQLDGKLKVWRPKNICYASRLNSLAIRADGSIVKCTIAFTHPINNIGKINSDGRLDLDRQKLMKWTRGIFTMDRESMRCPLKGIG